MSDTTTNHRLSPLQKPVFIIDILCFAARSNSHLVQYSDVSCDFHETIRHYSAKKWVSLLPAANTNKSCAEVYDELQRIESHNAKAVSISDYRSRKQPARALSSLTDLELKENASKQFLLDHSQKNLKLLIKTFHRACQHSILWLIKQLFVAWLDANNDDASLLINAKDPLTGSTALHEACRKDQPDVVSLLLDYAPDKQALLCHQQGLMQYPLTIAVQNGAINVVKFLLLENPEYRKVIGDFSKQAQIGKDTALHLAVRTSKIDMIKCLMKAAEVAKDDDGVETVNAEFFLFDVVNDRGFSAFEEFINSDYPDDVLDAMLLSGDDDHSKIRFEERVRNVITPKRSFLQRLAQGPKLHRCQKWLSRLAELGDVNNDEFIRIEVMSAILDLVQNEGGSSSTTDLNKGQEVSFYQLRYELFSVLFSLILKRVRGDTNNNNVDETQHVLLYEAMHTFSPILSNVVRAVLKSSSSSSSNDQEQDAEIWNMKMLELVLSNLPKFNLTDDETKIRHVKAKLDKSREKLHSALVKLCPSSDCFVGLPNENDDDHSSYYSSPESYARKFEDNVNTATGSDKQTFATSHNFPLIEIATVAQKATSLSVVERCLKVLKMLTSSSSSTSWFVSMRKQDYQLHVPGWNVDDYHAAERIIEYFVPTILEGGSDTTNNSSLPVLGITSDKFGASRMVSFYGALFASRSTATKMNSTVFHILADHIPLGNHPEVSEKVAEIADFLLNDIEFRKAFGGEQQPVHVAPVYCPDAINGDLPIHRAAKVKNFPFIKVLCEYDQKLRSSLTITDDSAMTIPKMINMQTLNENKSTALHLCTNFVSTEAEYNFIENMVNELGADPTIADAHGNIVSSLEALRQCIVVNQECGKSTEKSKKTRTHDKSQSDQKLVLPPPSALAQLKIASTEAGRGRTKKSYSWIPVRTSTNPETSSPESPGENPWSDNSTSEETTISSSASASPNPWVTTTSTSTENTASPSAKPSANPWATITTTAQPTSNNSAAAKSNPWITTTSSSSNNQNQTQNTFNTPNSFSASGQTTTTATTPSTGGWGFSAPAVAAKPSWTSENWKNSSA